MPALTPPDPPLTDGVVTIRERRASDADAFIAALGDPEIPRWTTVPADYSRADWDAFLVDADAQAREGRGLHLAIVDAQDRLLGAIGLIEVDWERSHGEIGYWLAREARGRGHMVRALRLLAAHAHSELGLRTLELSIEPENEPSRRAARAAGFAEDAIKPGPQRCGRRPVLAHVSSVP